MIRFYNFIIQSNLYISFAAASLYTYYGFILDKNFFLSTPVFVFCSTYITYNLLRFIPYLTKSALASNYRKWYDSHKYFTITSLIISSVFCLYSLQDFTNAQQKVILTLFVVTFFYDNPLVAKLSIRKLGYLKPFFIGLIWSGVCVGLHIQDYDRFAIYVLIDCFIFISLLCLAFDLKDVKYDLDRNLKTIMNTFYKRGELIPVLGLIYTMYLGFYHVLISDYHFEFNYLLQIIVFCSTLVYIRFYKNSSHTLFALAIDGIIFIKVFALFDYLPWLKQLLEIP